MIVPSITMVINFADIKAPNMQYYMTEFSVNDLSIINYFYDDYRINFTKWKYIIRKSRVLMIN